MDNSKHPSVSPSKGRDRNSFARRLERTFASFARKTSSLIGSSYSFAGAVLLVIVWALTGPMFGYSETWQLVINTGTTIITFLMVFLLQHTQNKDGLAIQLKLDEIIGALNGANNKMIDIEEMDEDDLIMMKNRYKKRMDAIKDVRDSRESLSMDPDEDD